MYHFAEIDNLPHILLEGMEFWVQEFEEMGGFFISSLL